MLADQSFLGRADRIDHVGLAPATDGCALWPADFHDSLAGLVEEGGQASAVAADALQGPAAAAGNVLAGEVQQAPVAAGVGGGVSAGHDRANGADGCGSEGVAVGVDADDAVDLFCEHGHAVVLLMSGTTVSGSAWVESPRGRTVMSHVEMADKLLIKPTGWARPTSTSGRHLGGTTSPDEPSVTL